MLIAATAFALASLPTLLLQERAIPRAGRALDAWREVARTLREAARVADLARFLLVPTVYQAGVTVIP